MDYLLYVYYTYAYVQTRVYVVIWCYFAYLEWEGLGLRLVQAMFTGILSSYCIMNTYEYDIIWLWPRLIQLIGHPGNRTNWSLRRWMFLRAESSRVRKRKKGTHRGCHSPVLSVPAKKEFHDCKQIWMGLSMSGDLRGILYIAGSFGNMWLEPHPFDFFCTPSYPDSCPSLSSLSISEKGRVGMRWM